MQRQEDPEVPDDSFVVLLESLNLLIDEGDVVFGGVDAR